MRCCKNCINSDSHNPCGCRDREKWELASAPTVCDGCRYLGRYQPTEGACRYCLDGSHYAPERRRINKKAEKIVNMFYQEEEE